MRMNSVKFCNMKLLVVSFYHNHLKTLLFKHAGNHVLGVSINCTETKVVTGFKTLMCDIPVVRVTN